MKMKYPEFAKRFKSAVKHSGVEDTQEGLSKLLGVSSVMIWSYRNGEKMPRMSTATRMAETLGVSVDWLLTGKGEQLHIKEKSPTYSAPGTAAQKIPVIEWNQAQEWGLNATIKGSDSITVDSENSENWYSLLVTNDSMSPKIPVGAYLAVDPDAKAKSGDLVIAKLPDVEIPTFRKLVSDAGITQLHPLNDKYPAITAPEGTSILGVVRSAIIRF